MNKLIFILSIVIFSNIYVFAQNATVNQSKISQLTESNFYQSTKSGLFLVDFYADWCRPCKLMRPVLEEFANEYQNKIKVVAVNTDNNRNLSSKYNISGIPCLVLLKDGKEVKRIIGYKDKASLVSELSQWLK